MHGQWPELIHILDGAFQHSLNNSKTVPCDPVHIQYDEYPPHHHTKMPSNRGILVSGSEHDGAMGIEGSNGENRGNSRDNNDLSQSISHCLYISLGGVILNY